MPATLRVKLTAKRQVTFPRAALDALGARPGDTLTLTERNGAWLLAPDSIRHGQLAPLREKLRGRRIPDLDLARWRETRPDHARLRD